MRLLIIQPWFDAIGHPAQSLINMASAIGKDERVDYLVSSSSESKFFVESLERLRSWGRVERYVVKTPTGYSNTAKALLTVLRMRLKGCRYQRIFFFDETLFLLALLWPFFSPWIPVERMGVLHLNGPNFGSRGRVARFVIGRFLKRREVRLYLRTEELAQAWVEIFKDVVGQYKISTLPSLEIPDGAAYPHPLGRTDQVRFGVIGQIRPGKSLEWLVPLFQKHPDIGKLTVAGAFASQEVHVQMSFLDEFEGFVSCFMSEDEMLERASMQDYLLMLYDGSWDKRMESAVLYLAARVNRPVVVYGDSWSGRMVREFGCGVVAPVAHEESVDFLQGLPRPGSVEYDSLLNGMNAFRQSYSVNSLRGKVIQELLG